LSHFVCVCVCVCVGEIISLPWFSKELKNDLSKNSCLCGVIFVLLVRESIFIGWGSPFPIVLVPRYKLSLCHTPIKPNLLDFSGIGVFACGLCDHVITRFASVLMSRYKLFLCHTPIKPDLLDFLRIDVFVCGLLDRVFKRFASNLFFIVYK
jgi:hypothetical protein